ncbi:unnamed protein product [Brassica rapa]|uniref:Uncharacterized protein n=2 Tax=Brassica TaxID=3705 RepID=A0A3P5YF42_BRACM|nr:unnamed protein product [Brassica napus]CAG7861845.1 unnamed protein product [Brassica rapa]CDY13071.1 BnaA09g17460D [Brassica napus]VDC60140.1 unnamed protein product [Brassica rapa]
MIVKNMTIRVSYNAEEGSSSAIREETSENVQQWRRNNLSLEIPSRTTNLSPEDSVVSKMPPTPPSVSVSIVLRHGRLSDLIAQLQELLKGAEGVESTPFSYKYDSAALAAQVL